MKVEKKALLFFFDGKQYETFEQYMSGAKIKQIFGLPASTNLYLAVEEGYEPELIKDDTEVDFARKEAEHFFVKEKLKFTINDKPFTWYTQYISNAQLRELGKIPADQDVYLQSPPPYEDELITNDRKVNLALPGKEHFVSKPRSQKVIISVNGRDREWLEPKISYDQVVAIAREGKPNNGAPKYYLVTYFDGPPQNPKGELTKDQSVFVTNNMMFNATPSDKS